MTATGRQAETAAAAYLTAHDFAIIDRNYRTRRCEIDIVARRGACLYFVEVKYRALAAQGSGLEYVTPRKQQMRFAAEVWTAAHDWRGEYTLAAIEVSGPMFAVGTFVESID